MMTASSMADHIISSINKTTDPATANNSFYSALCSYVEANAEVYYSWKAALTSPPYSVDPVVVIKPTIKTSGTLTPSGATDPGEAMSIFTQTLNANIATWTMVWPPGFTLTPCFILPSVTITPSGATDQKSAMEAVCAQIIAGILLATPAATGSHASFIGAATFTSIS